VNPQLDATGWFFAVCPGLVSRSQGQHTAAVWQVGSLAKGNRIQTVSVRQQYRQPYPRTG